MNSSNGVKVASGSGTTATWTANSPGKYIILATSISSNSSGTIQGYGSFIFNSQISFFSPGLDHWCNNFCTAINSYIYSL
jgi:hypothetical protein